MKQTKTQMLGNLVSINLNILECKLVEVSMETMKEYKY